MFWCCSPVTCYTALELTKAGENVLICDVAPGRTQDGQKFPVTLVDITDPASLAKVPIRHDDIVYNFAARMLHPVVPRRQRHEYFYSVDYQGAIYIIEAMKRAGCGRLIQFSTDMVYGRPMAVPVKVDHPRSPLGEYSASKKALEDYCMQQRRSGLRVSIFRPRLINGPGRLGILESLFRMIRHSRPVPLIGNGDNQYQMISVFDCASAAIHSAHQGVLDGEFNLGSIDPPKVRDLLRELIRSAGSRSALLPTPAALVKVGLRLLDRINLPVLVPEQFEIADVDYVLDIDSTCQRLGWRPKYG